jgi:sucrose synthase
LCRLKNLGKGMLQPHQIIAEYNNAIPEAEREKLKDGAFEDVLRAAQVCTRFRDINWTAMLLTFDAVLTNDIYFVTQEAIVISPWVALAIRPRPGVWEYVRVNVSELAVEELKVPEYLQFKEQLVEEGYTFCTSDFRI